MIRLRTGYLITGIITGLLLLLSFFATIPDGKLHIVFCDVGQGDGIYIKFPDGKDMVVDGGPNNKIISCLSRHMPFWDRTLDMVLLTHPEKDHFNGLLEVFKRYRVQYLVRSDVKNTTEGFDALTKLVKQQSISEKFVKSGEIISVGPSKLSILWPSKEQIASMNPKLLPDSGQSVLGASVGSVHLNDASVVFVLSYGVFDALFTGDADSHVQSRMLSFASISMIARTDGIIELFKVPHHGSKTGMTDDFLQQISLKRPGLTKLHSVADQKPLAVISVGKNSYGHPAGEILSLLKTHGFDILRTDQTGEIEVTSDGMSWNVKTGR